jgi:hypothetical protein
MVKLTVMYNLPEGADHEAFLAWRTTEHQRSNASVPDVIRTDFYVATRGLDGPPRYKYVTEAWFETMEALEAAFLTGAARKKLDADVERIFEPVFIISEEVIADGTLGES